MKIRTLVLGVIAPLLVSMGVSASTTTIEQSGQQFSEKSLALQRGDSVTFANHDDVTHNIGVVDADDEVVDLGLQKPGQSLTYEFDKAGRFKVRCSIHPSMKMTINAK